MQQLMAKPSVLSKIKGKLLPQDTIARSKRIFFITTLYLQMAREFEPSLKALEDLNRRFGLVNNPDALKWPSRFRGDVWGKRAKGIEEADEKLAQGDLHEACNTVMQLTPKWLHYASSEGDMRSDIEQVAKVVVGERSQQRLGTTQLM